jgi:hypothetical protein
LHLVGLTHYFIISFSIKVTEKSEQSVIYPTVSFVLNPIFVYKPTYINIYANNLSVYILTHE